METFCITKMEQQLQVTSATVGLVFQLCNPFSFKNTTQFVILSRYNDHKFHHGKKTLTNLINEEKTLTKYTCFSLQSFRKITLIWMTKNFIAMQDWWLQLWLQRFTPLIGLWSFLKLILYLQGCVAIGKPLSTTQFSHCFF